MNRLRNNARGDSTGCEAAVAGVAILLPFSACGATVLPSSPT